MVATYYQSKSFDPGFRLIDGDLLNRTLANPTPSSYAGVTALAGGGSAGSPILQGQINELAVCATAADSARLGQMVPGQTRTVKNSGAAAAAIFPYGSQTLNGLTTAATLAAGAIADYTCITPDTIVLNAPSGAYTGTFDGIIGGVTPSSAAFVGATFSSAISVGSSYTSTGVESHGGAETHTGVMTVTQLGRAIGDYTSTTTSTFLAYSVASQKSTAAASYTLPVPALGCEVEINYFAGSTQIMTITTAAGTGILSSRMNNSAGSTDLTLMDHVIALTLAGQSVTLRGLSTYQWAITSLQAKGSTILLTTG